MKIHPIFNTDQLKSYYGKTSEIKRNQPEVIKGVEEWEIEDIKGEKDNEFLVKWKGYKLRT